LVDDKEIYVFYCCCNVLYLFVLQKLIQISFSSHFSVEVEVQALVDFIKVAAFRADFPFNLAKLLLLAYLNYNDLRRFITEVCVCLSWLVQRNCIKTYI